MKQRKMKNIKTYLLMAAMAFSTTACLDKYPDDMVPTDKAITTVDEVDQAVIGIYSSWLNGALCRPSQESQIRLG